MPSPLFQRRTMWWPTGLGWMVVLVLFVAPAVLWFFQGEAFFSRDQRLPAEVLIVEGWIGLDGMRAAQTEFDRGNYRYVVTAGALTDNHWGPQRWNYAVEAQKALVRLGVPADRVITAPAVETAAQRTFAAALAVKSTLAERGLQIKSANVFTMSVHARRSRLIFAKVLPETEVGVVSWHPAGEALAPWWKSSERAEALLKETAGYLFELLLNSGRSSNSSPPPPKP